MAKLISSTGTNHVEVASKEEANAIQNLLAKHGIKVDVQAETVLKS